MTPTIYWILLLSIGGFAIARGGVYERLAGIVCIGASVLTLLIHSVSAVEYSGVALGDLTVDCAVLVAFITIALLSDRFWPLWVAALELTTISGHVMKFADSSLFPHAYAAAVRLWSYPILLIIGIGAWRAHRRRSIEPAG